MSHAIFPGKFIWSLSALILLLGGCGASSQKPVESPEAVSAAPEAPAGADDEAVTEKPSEVEPTDEAQAETGEQTNEEILGKPTQPPIEILTRSSVAFVINFDSSKLKSEASCNELPSDDPKRIADCKKAARAKYHADIMRFKKASGNGYVWEIYKRKNNNLIKLYTIPVQIKQEGDRTIKVTKSGKSTGAQQVLVGVKQFVVTVPDDYTIELDDPELGQLSYDSRLGLFGE